MKRHFIFVFCFVLKSIVMSSQDSIRVYLDLNYESVANPGEATIIRDVVKKNGRYFISDQYANGREIMKGEYASINPWTEDGLFSYYDDQGNIYAKGKYSMGLLSGKWIYYTGHAPDTVDYEDIAVKLKENKPAKKQKDLQNVMFDSPELISWIKPRIHFPPRMLGTVNHSRVKVNIAYNPEMGIKKMILFSEHPDFEIETIRLLNSAPENLLIVNKSKPSTTTIEVYFFNIYYDFRAISCSDNEENNADSSDAAYLFVDEQALFQGGTIDNYREWIQRNVHYPAEAIAKGQSGRATVQFTVNTAGKVDRIKILRSSGVKVFDDEVLKLMRNSPAWKPAKIKGKLVSQQLVMPIVLPSW